MRITAVCPYCRETHHLEPWTNGKTVRCVNGRCAKPFVVEAIAKTSGTVDEMVELLPAELELPLAPANHVSDRVPAFPAEPPEPVPELAPPPPDQAAPEAASWRDTPPPVRRGTGVEPAETRAPQNPPTVHRRRSAAETMLRKRTDTHYPEAIPEEKKPVPERVQPVETRAKPTVVLEPDVDEFAPPPVHREGEAHGTLAVAEKELPATYSGDDDFAPPRRRKAGLLIGGMLFLAGGVIALVCVVWFALQRESEEKIATDAYKQYDDGVFNRALERFKAVATAFPESERIDEYRFMQALSEIRLDVANSTENVDEYFTKLDRFLDTYKSDKRFKERAKDLRATLVAFSGKLAEKYATAANAEPVAQVERLGTLVGTVQKALGNGNGFTSAENGEINRNIGQVLAAVEKWRHRQEVLAYFDDLLRKPPVAGIRAARDLLAREPEFKDDAEIKGKVDQLYELHFQSITYKEEQASLPKPGADDSLPRIYVDPVLKEGAGTAAEGKRVWLALVNGLLYGLSRGDGHVKWVSPLGIDTTTLPVRVEQSDVSQERILALSSDTKSLTALNGDGKELWTYRLESPSLGRPTIDGQRAYLCTVDGQVHEIELINGQLIGRYDLKHSVSLGATFDASTNLLYVAADDTCVYVLDTQAKRCDNILYTYHPSGSLRSEPIVTTPHYPDVPGYLVLNQADSLKSARLNVYALPLPAKKQIAVPAMPQAPRMPGWTWFSPFRDAEKTVLLSDAGVLGLYGFKQPFNNDPPLFPLLGGPAPAGEPAGGVPLDAIVPPDDRSRGQGRALVVHVQGDDLWVLVHGKLQQLRIAWTEAAGPRVVGVWDKALELGSPLHSSQVQWDQLGRNTFFLVTQSLGSPACLATAIKDDGTILWQRQLGLVSQGEPLVLSPANGRPAVLVMDQGGGLVSFDTAARRPGADHVLWQRGGKILAPGFDENPSMLPLLLAGPVPGTALQVACPGNGKKLVLRQIEAGGKISSVEGMLPDSLQGTPAVVDDKLIMPLASGELYAVRLPWDGTNVLPGENWRDPTLGPEARGYVTALGNHRVLYTNGSRGLYIRDWSKDVPAPIGNREPTAFQMPARIVAAPLLLPALGDGRTNVLVADSQGVLSLLNVNLDTGEIENVRHWNLKGRITAEPFLHGEGKDARVGCIVDKVRLVWLDPRRVNKPAWEYSTDGKAILGLPRLAGDMLIVVDQSGHYVGLDPATGRRLGPGYHLHGSMNPAAPAVAFDADRLFAPLSDGTILLLPVELLRASGRTPAPTTRN